MDNYEDNKAMITEALAYIPADDYDTYRDVVAALKHEAIAGKLAEADAEDMARTWAQSSAKFDPKEFAAKWKSFKDAYGGDLIGAGSIIKMAKDYGYKPTGPQAAAFDVGSTIDLSGLSTADMDHSMNALPDGPLPPSEQEKQIMQFLDLFGDNERVNIVVQASQKMVNGYRKARAQPGPPKNGSSQYMPVSPPERARSLTFMVPWMITVIISHTTRKRAYGCASIRLTATA